MMNNEYIYTYAATVHIARKEFLDHQPIPHFICYTFSSLADRSTLSWLEIIQNNPSC